MKKGSFTLMGTRKDPSRLSTSSEIKERGNVNPSLDSPIDPELGTAKVKAKPTVKHYTPSSLPSADPHGFAVPTPKVPLMPPTNGMTSNGRANANVLPSGSAILNSLDSEIDIPLPPPMKPPPPPTNQAHFSSIDASDLPAWQPPSPKPVQKMSHQHSDLSPLTSSLKIPSKSSVSSPSTNVFDSYNPAFTKDANLPIFSGTTLPAEQLEAQVTAPSSFNPQNNAKLYNMPKDNFLIGKQNTELKPNNSIIFIEDSLKDKIPVQANSKPPTAINTYGSTTLSTSPAKPTQSINPQLQKDLPEVKDILQAGLPNKVTEANVHPVKDFGSDILNGPPYPAPEVFSRPHNTNSKSRSVMTPASKSYKHSFDVSRKPYYLQRGSRDSQSKDQMISPFALLHAARERERRKSSTSNEPSSKDATSTNHSAAADLSSLRPPSSASVGGHVAKLPGRQDPDPVCSTPLHHLANKQNSSMPFIPPPPEFANFKEDAEDDHSWEPPKVIPPDPPVVRTHPVALPPADLSTPSPAVNFTKPSGSPMVPPPEPPPLAMSTTDRQKTLQSILERKELDQGNSLSSDYLGQSQSEADSGIPDRQSPTSKMKSVSIPHSSPAQVHNLVLSELGSKVAKNTQDSSLVSTETNSSGAQLKQTHGKTFMVRPGNKQPISIIRK